MAINSAITATFSEVVDSNSITIATFTSSGALAYSNTYTATVTTGVTDLACNAMLDEYTWSLTTTSGQQACYKFDDINSDGFSFTPEFELTEKLDK